MSITPQTRQLAGLDGLQLVIDEWPAPGPLVMLLHGGGQTRHSWKDAGSRLTAAGVHAVSLDLRGHGDSAWAPDGNYGLPALRGDIINALEQLGRSATLVGASLGGLTSLLVAQARPDIVERLVLVDVVTRIEPAGSERIRGFMQSAPEGFADLDEAAEAVSAYLPHRARPRSTDGLRKNLRQHEDGRWHWHWDPAMFQLPQGGSPEGNPLTMQAELDDAARSLQVPTLLLQGALSDVVSDEGVEHFRSLVPHLRVERLADAAHTAAADDNDAFTRSVLDFVLEAPNS
ncbi:putative hydrolase [Janibacter sp. HTCC2649]|uniref:alpha/beta fold hydrolase n=1 Tax=Janibacter sp. HTCC2649 TaxID=313589 RepID=UPI0000670AE1|nr:alpha/beta hydrolase [Janibacter sp. HTCC2649]EAQ00633.1 putative hydrolase [Janibacter sp. HTCC2649]